MPGPPKEDVSFSFTESDSRLRFQIELEFVQALANPNYIHYLGQMGYFDDPAFVNYLQYLKYWCRPPYVLYITYPHCLYFLELLQNGTFREAMKHPGNKEEAHQQQYYFWLHYRNNRLLQMEADRLAQTPRPGGCVDGAADGDGDIQDGSEKENARIAADDSSDKPDSKGQKRKLDGTSVS